MPGRHDKARVQIKSIRPGVTMPGSGRLDRLGGVAQTTKAGAPARSQRDGPPHGRGGEAGEDRRLVGPRVRRIRLAVAGSESSA